VGTVRIRVKMEHAVALTEQAGAAGSSAAPTTPAPASRKAASRGRNSCNSPRSRGFKEAVAYPGSCACHNRGGERGRTGMASLATPAVSNHVDIKFSASSDHAIDHPADEQRHPASAACPTNDHGHDHDDSDDHTGPCTAGGIVGSSCRPESTPTVDPDGATVYCARIQYTDGYVWSHSGARDCTDNFCRYSGVDADRRGHMQPTDWPVIQLLLERYLPGHVRRRWPHPNGMKSRQSDLDGHAEEPRPGSASRPFAIPTNALSQTHRKQPSPPHPHE
jgi:hypothetical protein